MFCCVAHVRFVGFGNFGVAKKGFGQSEFSGLLVVLCLDCVFMVVFGH